MFTPRSCISSQWRRGATRTFAYCALLGMSDFEGLSRVCKESGACIGDLAVILNVPGYSSSSGIHKISDDSARYHQGPPCWIPCSVVSAAVNLPYEMYSPRIRRFCGMRKLGTASLVSRSIIRTSAGMSGASYPVSSSSASTILTAAPSSWQPESSGTYKCSPIVFVTGHDHRFVRSAFAGLLLLDLFVDPSCSLMNASCLRADMRGLARFGLRCRPCGLWPGRRSGELSPSMDWLLRI